MHPCEPFRSGAPHAYFGAHRLKSADVDKQPLKACPNLN